MMMRGGGTGMGGGGGWGRGSMMRTAEGDSDGAPYDHRVVMRLIPFLAPHWRRLIVTFAGMLVYTGTVVAIPWVIKWTVDSYIRTRDISGLDWAVVIFVIIASVQLGTNYFHLRQMAFIGQRVLYNLRMRLFRHLQRLSMSYFDRHQVGSVMSRVQNDVQQLQEFLSVLLVSLADLLALVGVIGAMLFLNVRLALITLTVVPLLILILAVWQKYARASFMRVRQAIAEVNSGLQENIAGVRVVQSLNRERVNYRRFGQANYEHLDANLRATRFQAALLPAVEILSALGLALVVFFGGSMVLDGSLEVGVVIAFALYIQRFFDPIRNLTMHYSQLQRAMASGAHIFELLDTKPEVSDKPDAVQQPSIRGEIRYEGVGFHYEPDSPVLQDINLHVRPGETVALVGPTGAGKSTLVALLLRLYDVTEGRITVDGHDVREVKQESLVRQTSIVLQEPYLFSGTVRDNIRFNRTEVADEEVVKAATAVGADEFISKLAEGYDTQLQERGGNLSIGQRQLISLARALVADPRILILDEATANVDTYTETLIQQALRELLRDRTAVVIAHRLSTVRNADRIVVLDQGRVIEQGNHVDLMALGGLYTRLQSFTVDGQVSKPLAIDGKWNLTLNTPRGSRNGTLELSTLGSILSGRWAGERGTSEFTGGAVDGDRLTWQIEISGPRGTMYLDFRGAVDGAKISGDVDFGEMGSGSFVATRL